MKPKLVAAILTALCAFFAESALASGYGPAPRYEPVAGAPASQRGQSADTLAAERRDSAETQFGYGGMAAVLSQSGSRTVATLQRDVYAHH